MNLQQLREAVSRDLAEANIGNDRITAQTITKVLNDVYLDVCTESECLTRTAYVATWKNQFEYDLPIGIFKVYEAWIGQHANTPHFKAVQLQLEPISSLRRWKPNYRYADPGIPQYAYFPDARKRIGIFPPPHKDITIDPEDQVLAVLQTRVRQNNTITVTSINTPLAVTIGEIVWLTDGDYGNGLFVVTAINGQNQCTVWAPGQDFIANYPGKLVHITPLTIHGACIPLAKSVVTANEVVDSPTLLEDDTDQPAFADNFHQVLVHGAVYRLATRFLNDGEFAREKALVAKEDYNRLLAQLAAIRAVGVNHAPSVAPGEVKR